MGDTTGRTDEESFTDADLGTLKIMAAQAIEQLHFNPFMDQQVIENALIEAYKLGTERVVQLLKDQKRKV